MWLALKYHSAKAKPAIDKLLLNELGLQGSIHYKRLLERFPPDEAPQAQRGPDETISDHYSRLNTLLDKERADYEQSQADKRERERKPTFDETWNQAEPEGAWEAMQADKPEMQKVPLGGMPRRNPGWFTGDSPLRSTPPPDHGTPPMDRRTPGARYAPHYEPPRQTMDQWHKFLADKGIVLDETGHVPGAASPADMLPRRKPMPPRGQDIWGDLVRRAMAKRGE